MQEKFIDQVTVKKVIFSTQTAATKILVFDSQIYLVRCGKDSLFVPYSINADNNRLLAKIFCRFDGFILRINGK